MAKAAASLDRNNNQLGYEIDFTSSVRSSGEATEPNTSWCVIAIAVVSWRTGVEILLVLGVMGAGISKFLDEIHRYRFQNRLFLIFHQPDYRTKMGN